MAVRRWVTSLDQSRLAATSGAVFMGLGFARRLQTIEEAIELLRSGSITGNVFIGVQIDGSGVPGLRAYEGTDETGGKRTAKRGRSRRNQR